MVFIHAKYKKCQVRSLMSSAVSNVKSNAFSNVNTRETFEMSAKIFATPTWDDDDNVPANNFNFKVN